MLIGVVANHAKPLTSELLRRLAAVAQQRGLDLMADPEIVSWLAGAATVPSTGWPPEMDILVVLGGDGTLLKAVRDLGGRKVPVLGVNCGSLGFLTSVAAEDLERAIHSLADGDYRVGERTTAACCLFREKRQRSDYSALNDMVISSGGQARIATLRMRIDDYEVTDFLCDGLILATPTGSTGHALSAGGPIVVPEAPVFLISPICCHTLSTRPLVVPDGSTIDIDVIRCSQGMWLAVDGQTGEALQDGDHLVFQRGTPTVQLVHLPGYRYFDVLRQKLHWRGTNL